MPPRLGKAPRPPGAGGRAAARPARRRLPRVDVAAHLRILKRLYPGARCSLDFRNPYELLVATILSAQCTDERVNQVTPALFARYPTAEKLARAELPELEAAIRPTGFFRAKARSLASCARDIVAGHGGRVPDRLEDLVALHGVGRKTANVVLGNAYGIPGITVDTHVGRLSRRLGLTARTDPVQVEQDLMERVPRREWTLFSHLLIHHGRAVCLARRPRCEACALARHCPKLGVPAPIRAAAPAFEEPAAS